MKNNNIITIVLVVLIAMVAYWYLNKTDSSTAYLTSDVKTTDSADAKYIYDLLQKMNQVTLDNSIFSDTAFKSLKDNTVSFPAQVAGRDNPFAPVGFDFNPGQGSQSTSSKNQR